MSGVKNWATLRPLTLASSLPDRCDVCRGARVVRLVSVFGIPAIGATPCPHCSAAGHAAVEVRPLPSFDDTQNRSA